MSSSERLLNDDDTNLARLYFNEFNHEDAPFSGDGSAPGDSLVSR